jgi:hypothetical protein
LINFKKLIKIIEKLFYERIDYLNENKFIQLIIKSKPLNASSQYEEKYFCVLIRFGSLVYSIFIGTNSKEIIYIPIQIKSIEKDSIEIKIVEISENQFKNQKLGKKDKVLYDKLKLGLNQIHLIKGFNLELKYDDRRDQFDVFSSQKDKSMSIKSISSLKSIKSLKIDKNLNSLIKFKLKSDFESVLKRSAKSNYPKIKLELNWSFFNVYDFSNLEAAIKDELNRYHQSHIEQHLKLLKYIFIHKIQQINDSQLINDLFKENINFESFFGYELNAILEQNLFEGGLKYTDHFFCIKKVLKELQTHKDDYLTTNKNFQEINFYNLLEKFDENFIYLDPETFTLSAESQEEFLSFLIKPFEKLNKKIPHDLPFDAKSEIKIKITELNNLCKLNLMNWYFLPNSWFEKRLQIELPFNFDKMRNQFLDDFDLTSNKVKNNLNYKY